MNCQDLVGKWMIDHAYGERNSLMPLWAKDIWDCRLLIVYTRTYVREERECLTLGVMYGFQVSKYVEEDQLLISAIPKSKPGWINDVTFKDKEVYSWEKHRATLLDEGKPHLAISLGQVTLF